MRAPSSRAGAQTRDLLRKHYLLSDDGRECGGLYVWPTREAAEAAHDAAWRAGVEQRTGAPPTIRYFQLQMLLDNEAGTVTEWSKTGEKVTAPRPQTPAEQRANHSSRADSQSRAGAPRVIIQSGREIAALLGISKSFRRVFREQ